MAAVAVQAHPLDESYSAALLGAAVDGLRRAGVDVQAVRLNRGDVLDAEALEAADHVVFVYPTWWGGMPAMLLGPLGELLGSWVDGDETPATSPLRSVRRLTVITTYGGSRLINRLQGNAGRHFFERTVTRLCAPSVVYECLAIHDVVNAGEAELQDFLDEVRSTVSSTA